MKIELTMYDAKVCAPIKSGTYFTVHEAGCANLFYSKRHGAWNCTDDEDTPQHELFPNYWANEQVTSDTVQNK